MDQLTNFLLTAQTGDKDAFAMAVRLGQTDVARYLRPLVDPTDLDDVIQDTFIRAYRAVPRYRGDASGRTWLLAIARRAAADATRARIRRRRIEQRARADLPSLTTPNVESAHGVQSLIDHLDEAQRDAFVLTQLVGCTYAQAAKICRVPIGTIRSRVARARSELLDQVRAARSA